MENSDRDLILKVIKTNKQLKRLYDEHVVLERELDQFSNRSYLTPEEHLREKLLKKQKLEGVDRMMQLVAPFREEAVPQAA